MVFVPIAVASLVLFGLVRSSGKKKVSPKRTDQQKQTDELITVVLPIISNNK